MKKQTVSLFFATDDKYAPLLAVAIASIKAHADSKRAYEIHVLMSELSDETKETLLRLVENSNLSVDFVSVAEKLDAFGNMLHLRDYYSKATYFRFFVPELFPELDKAVYLDCDVVLCDDVAKLFDVKLKNNLVAAAQEEVMANVDVFGRYVEHVLGIDRRDYFNAGMLVMNLAKMREENIEGQFVALLKKYTFSVTQDEDYLNVLCHGKSLMLPVEWNKTPYPDDVKDDNVKMVHYKLYFKPWRYADVRFENAFWQNALHTPYFAAFAAQRENYSESEKLRDEKEYLGLVRLAESEIKNNTSFYKNEVELCNRTRKDSWCWNESENMRNAESLI